MSIVLLAVIVGSLFYVSRIVLEYRARETKIVPEVEALERKLTKFESQIDQETEALAGVKERVAALRVVREELMRETETVKTTLVTSKARYQELSLDMQKRQFRGTLARGRQLAMR